MSNDRVQAATSKILDAIASKKFKVGEALPPEAELAEWLEVARPTMREAVRTLTERGVLNVVHGRGTFVVPPLEWTDLGSIIWWTSQTSSPRELGMYLSEVRRMIEVGACGLAAERRDATDIERLQKTLVAYDDAIDAGDLEAATQADLEFHQAILSASKNPFLASVMEPLSTAMHDSRFQTTSISEIRDKARKYHSEILYAIEASDAQRAKDTMRAHMTQTRDDIMKHLTE
jgi:DNA-binding FadR family transcriptional regulator